MKRILPAVLGVAAIAAAAFFLLGSDDKEGDEKGNASKRPSASADHRGTGASGEGGRALPRPVRMGSDQGAVTPTAVAVTSHKTYYRDDGTEVRDHRKNAAEPDLTKPVAPRKGIITIRPSTLQEVRRSVNPSLDECLEPARPTAEEGARAQAVLTVSVHNEVLHVDDLQVQSEGIADHEAFKACMTGKLMGYSMSTPEEAEVDSYKLTFPLRL